ncbi:hypothetical protein SBRCBS47491_003507 [Sporothrix bragantina]|uniref:Heterokaryon incompatibility domain-containing protein n=1 Tax=Sporothrix bragantina TaxID=671064 RepID=A0ABP0BFZ2_9PEZI
MPLPPLRNVPPNFPPITSCRHCETLILDVESILEAAGVKGGSTPPGGSVDVKPAENMQDMMRLLDALDLLRSGEDSNDSEFGSIEVLESDEWVAFDPELTLDDVRQKAKDGCLFCADLLERGASEIDASAILVYWIEMAPDTTKMGMDAILFGFLGPDGDAVATRGYTLLVLPGNDDDDAKDGSAASLVPRRPINTDPRSAHTFGMARDWLQTCLFSHEDCPKPTFQFMPTRVLHILGSQDPGEVRLCLLETSTLAKPEPYVALSYCWGGEQKTKTIKANLSRFLDEAQGLPPWQTLPATIRDAVTATRELGFRYVFVDAFCIVQDDDGDKLREIAQMARIYSEATVTILASRAAAAADGFLGPRPSPVPNIPPEYCDLVCRLPVRCVGGAADDVLLAQFSFENATLDPIYTRAWTLQEQLLAPRTLVYGRHQTSWTCWSSSDKQAALTDGWSKTNGNGEEPLLQWDPSILRHPASPSRVPVDRQTVLEGWLNLVEHYTDRKLSFPGDKLPAVAAAAERVGDALLGDQYLAGLWKSDLPRGLFWYLSDLTRRPRPPAYRAPSWSWAAVDGKIRYPSSRTGAESVTLEVLECSVELVSPIVPYGAVKGGRLVVRGRLRHVRLRIPTEGYQYTKCCRVSELGRIGEEVILPVSLDAVEIDFKDGDVEAAMDAAVLELHNSTTDYPCCLVLREVKPGTYSRLGVMTRPARVRLQLHDENLDGDGGAGDASDNGPARTSSYFDWMKRFEDCVPSTITII